MTEDPIIVNSEQTVKLYVRGTDPADILDELTKTMAGKCQNGSYILEDSIRVLEVQPAVSRQIVDSSKPFRVSVRFSYREFMPVTGKVYECVVNKIDPKGTILRYILPGSGESAMVVTVIDRYSGTEGDRVPIMLTHKFSKNGRDEISAIGEFADA